jgi:RNA polymerase sigma factor (sigma-70 family)
MSSVCPGSTAQMHPGAAADERGKVMTLTVDTKPHRKPRAVRTRRCGPELAQLLTSAAGGDQRAWLALVQEFSGMIWAVARAYRLRDADAADVVQATWLRLLEHVGDLNDPGCVGAWLATTARRECLRVLRDNERHIPFGDNALEQESPEISPLAAVLTVERDRALWQGFTRLRADDQALLRLLMADPRPSYEENSAALDMPVGSIGPTRQRALERLRNQLDDADGTLALLTA